MSRKILKKIKLINWHYFENVELEVEDSALFFGGQRLRKIHCFGCAAICTDGRRKVF